MSKHLQHRVDKSNRCSAHFLSYQWWMREVSSGQAWWAIFGKSNPIILHMAVTPNPSITKSTDQATLSVCHWQVSHPDAPFWVQWCGNPGLHNWHPSWPTERPKLPATYSAIRALYGVCNVGTTYPAQHMLPKNLFAESAVIGRSFSTMLRMDSCFFSSDPM